MELMMLIFLQLQDTQCLVLLHCMIIRLRFTEEENQLGGWGIRYLLDGFLKKQPLKIFVIILGDLAVFKIVIFQRIRREVASGHRGFEFVTFAENGVADRVARRSHEICGQEVAIDSATPLDEAGPSAG